MWARRIDVEVLGTIAWRRYCWSPEVQMLSQPPAEYLLCDQGVVLFGVYIGIIARSCNGNSKE